MISAISLLTRSYWRQEDSRHANPTNRVFFTLAGVYKRRDIKMIVEKFLTVIMQSRKYIHTFCRFCAYDYRKLPQLKYFKRFYQINGKQLQCGAVHMHPSYTRINIYCLKTIADDQVPLEFLYSTTTQH